MCEQTREACETFISFPEAFVSAASFNQHVTVTLFTETVFHIHFKNIPVGEKLHQTLEAPLSNTTEASVRLSTTCDLQLLCCLILIHLMFI